MPEPELILLRDARGSLVHIRDRRTGQCRGCACLPARQVEAGLFELLRILILSEKGRNLS